MSKTTEKFPETQRAVQLVGAGELKLTTEKPVLTPGPHEILIKIEAVGLCFSDLKLLNQFDKHARKSDVLGGIAPDELHKIQSYVPNDAPVVPGHEVVCRVVDVGSEVRQHKIGERCLVQADFRDLPTAGSNAAFGYNFDGGLQEYCIVDERVVVDSRGERLLMPVGEAKSASAVALVEPWACVEDSYVNRERQTIKAAGRLLVVRDDGATVHGLDGGYSPEGPPAEVVNITPDKAAAQEDESFDDIVYLGNDRATLEILNDKLAPRGIMNVVLDGKQIGAKVNIGVGRIH